MEGVAGGRVALRAGLRGDDLEGGRVRVVASGPKGDQGADRGEGGEDVGGPGPGSGEAQVASAGAVGEASRDVQEPIAQRLGLARFQGGGQGEQP